MSATRKKTAKTAAKTVKKKKTAAKKTPARRKPARKPAVKKTSKARKSPPPKVKKKTAAKKPPKKKTKTTSRKTAVKKKPVKKPAKTAKKKTAKRRPEQKAPPAKKTAAPMPPETMEILSKRPKHTPAVFKLPTRKHTPIVFTLEDVREALKNKHLETEEETGGKPARATSSARGKPARKKKAPAARKKKKQVVGAASLSDILGFPSPSGGAKNKKAPAGRAPPRKWSRYYKMLMELRRHMADILNTHAQDTLKRSSKEDSGDLSGYGQHIADVGTDNFDRDFALTLLSNEQDALFEIDAAIDRIFDGTYGICEITGKPIAKERLAAVPFTRYSLEGQARMENKKHRPQERAGVFRDADEDSVLQFTDEDAGD